MERINIYLNFDGNCREAMNFYKECLGGELELQTVGESAMAAQMPHLKDSILHSFLLNNNMMIMASDMHMGELINGNAYSICINCSSEEEINRLYSALSAGGQALQPLSEMPWQAIMGALTDKYGKQWMFHYQK